MILLRNSKENEIIIKVKNTRQCELTSILTVITEIIVSQVFYLTKMC